MNIKEIKYTHHEYATGSMFPTPPSLSSIFYELSLYFYRYWYRLIKPPLPDCLPLSTDFDVNNAKNTNNKGLIVFIHGFSGSPQLGKLFYNKEIEKQAKGDFEVWIPYVPKKGNCSLEEAAKPILEMVEKYIRTNKGKPVQLIGHSNGGRIAAYIETRLRDKEVNIRVTGVAGAFFGSDLVKFANIFYNINGRTGLRFSKTFRNELQTGSQKSKELIEAMRKPVTKGSRSYTFYTTKDELVITNFTSCLPNIGQNEECVVVSGCGHIGILKKTCKKEVEKIINFLKSHPISPKITVGSFLENSGSQKKELENLATISA